MKRKILCLLLSITLIAGTLSAVLPSTVSGNTDNTAIPFAASNEQTAKVCHPAVNNGDYGYTEQVEYYDGEEVTLTAVPFTGYNFDGWYESSAADAAKLSSSTLYTVATPNYVDVTNRYINDPGAENTLKGTVLYTAGATDDEWTSATGASGTVEVSHLRHNTGKQSFKTTIKGNYVGRKLTGLTANKNYRFSYMFYLPTASSSQTSKIFRTLVTATSDAAAVRDSLENTDSEVLGYAGETLGVSGQWQKVTVDFNTGSNTDVTVWIRIGISGFTDAMTFLDDFTLSEDSSGSAVNLKNIEARFNPGDGAVTGLGFETGYTASDAPVVSFSNVKDPSTGLVPDGSYTAQHESLDITSTHRLYWQKAYICNNAHSGKNALKFSGSYSIVGIKLPLTLKKNTDYVLSFFMAADNSSTYADNIYILGKDNTPTNPVPEADQEFDSNRRKLLSANDEGVIALETDNIYCSTEYKEISIPFNSGDNTEISVWVNYSGSGAIYLDSFNAYEYYNVSVKAGTGGTAIVSGLHGEYAMAGSTLICSAVPESGNTFAGWYDASGILLSTDLNYYLSVNSNISVIAKFNGYNTPTRDLFALNGEDGTFENGTINGWFAYHPTASTSWCSYGPNTAEAFEGNSCLRISASYKSSVLPIKNLNVNTDYVLSLYVKQLDGASTKTILEDIGIVGDGATRFADSGNILVRIEDMAPGMGWQKVTLHFNSGDRTSVNFIVAYAAEPGDPPYLYIDNMFLYEYTSVDAIQNGNFDSNTASWINKVSYNSAEKAGQLSNAEDYTYQNLKVDKASAYTVKFRAKGDVFAAATEIGAGFPSILNSLSSVSNTKANSDSWKEYSFEFYSGENSAVAISFGSTNGGGLFDNVTVTKNEFTSGAVLENVDFETERFAIKDSDTSVWSIYNGTAGDNNVHSGTKSLKYTYNSDNLNSVVSFIEEYMGEQITSGITYRLTFWYKSVSGKSGGSVNLSPDYEYTYGTNKGFEYSAENSDWQKASFVYTASSQLSVKAMIRTVIGGTKSDFYFDDISLTVSEPALTQETTRYTYCEELYNVVKNGNFEKDVSNDNWANLQSTMKVVTGNALKGSHYLTASAGTKYVLKIPVQAGKEYHFGASMRTSTKAEGYIGVALSENVDANASWYCDTETAQPNSKIFVENFDGEWHRNGFQFVAANSGYVYVAIVVTSGTVDFDSIQMFLPEYRYWYDPNDYTVYEEYDFNARTSSSCVINGGYGEQPYYKKAN